MSVTQGPIAPALGLGEHTWSDPMKSQSHAGGLLGKARAATYAVARSRLADSIAIRIAVARHLARRGRRAAEQLLDDAARRTRRKPLHSLAVCFAVGLGIGTLAGWLAGHRD